MSTRFDLSLRLAQKITTVRRSTATDGDATSLTDSKLSGMGNWTDGSIWILSGDQAGQARSILTNPKDKVTFEALGGALAGDESYALADKHAPLDVIQGAIAAALDFFRTVKEDTSLTQDCTVQEYTIPAGVTGAAGYDGIVSVELATQASAPYEWTLPQRYWMEKDGKLRFEYGMRPRWDDCPMRLGYAVTPTLEADDDVVPMDVNYDALYWRALIELTDMLMALRPQGEDHERLTNLFEQAQVEWQRAARNVHRPRRADPLAVY